MKIYKKWWFWVIIIVVISIFSYFYVMGWLPTIYEYEKFSVTYIEDSNSRCEHYYESCTCFGFLYVLQSYPPKYDCTGINNCNEINPPRVECR